jgi:hypothetical protein
MKLIKKKKTDSTNIVSFIYPPIPETQIYYCFQYSCCFQHKCRVKKKKISTPPPQEFVEKGDNFDGYYINA